MKGKNRKLIPTVPASAVIDMAESRMNHFPQGMNAYKLTLFLGLQPNALQSEWPDMSALLQILGHSWCSVDENHIPLDGKADSEASQPGRKGADLGCHSVPCN